MNSASLQDLEAFFRQLTSLELKTLLGSGFFPRELPPCFTTSDFADVVTDETKTLPIEFTKRKDSWCGYSTFSLARPAALRRNLALLNPLPFFRLSAKIVEEQERLFKLASPGFFCLSHPKIQRNSQRAITTHEDWSSLPKARSLNRVAKKFILRTDIARFYPSVYTHSLDWAITGKKRAKENFGPRVTRLGARIDNLVQSAQGGQTRGLPIGPDTSLLLSHILLAPVDKALKRRKVHHGFRFMDDYELAFESRSEAEKALAILEEELGVFELELNSLKTRIVELPTELDHPGIQELRAMRIRPEGNGQDSDIIHFFSKAFELARRFPEKAILNYAVGRVKNLGDSNVCAKLTQELVLQCITAEPGVWPIALPLLQRLHFRFSDLPTGPIEKVIDLTIREQASKGHSSEVARSLWAALIFDFTLSASAAIAAARMQDDVCGLLLLHLESLGLAQISSTARKNLDSMAVEKELRGEHWLFAYEAVAQGWIQPPGGNYLTNGRDDVFKFLFAEDVRFYDVNALMDARIEERGESILDESGPSEYGSASSLADVDPDLF